MAPSGGPSGGPAAVPFCLVPVVAPPWTLCHRGQVDQEGVEPVFSAITDMDGDHVQVVATGEIDMSTADAMTRAAIRDGGRRVTLDLRQVTFFDSAAIHAVIRLAERFPGTLTVVPSRQVRRVLDISGLGEQGWLAPETPTAAE